MFNDKGEPKMFTDQEPTKEEVDKKDKKVIIIVAIMVVVLIALVVLYNLIINDVFSSSAKRTTTTHPGFRTSTTTSTSKLLITEDTTTTTTLPPNTTTAVVTTTTTSSTTKQAKIVHNLKISNLGKGDTGTYTLDAGQVAKIKMKKIDGNKIDIDILYNDRKVTSQKLNSRKDLQVYLLGHAFIYMNLEKGNEDYKHIYIMRETRPKEVYEMDTIKGMNPDTVSIQGNKFIVNASRIAEDGTVKYGSALGIDLCDESTWSMGFTYSSILQATYTYTLTNHMLSEQAVYNNPVTVKQYLDSTGMCN